MLNYTTSFHKIQNAVLILSQDTQEQIAQESLLLQFFLFRSALAVECLRDVSVRFHVYICYFHKIQTECNAIFSQHTQDIIVNKLLLRQKSLC